MATEYKTAHTLFDWLLEAIALASLATMWVLIAMNMGVKRNLWLLPLLGTMHYLLLSALSVLRLSPQHDSPEAQGVRLRFLTWVKASMLASLAYIAWVTLETAKGRANGLESGFIPAALAIIVLPALATWRRMRKTR